MHVFHLTSDQSDDQALRWSKKIFLDKLGCVLKLNEKYRWN